MMGERRERAKNDRIKDLLYDERPREKFMNKGASALTNAELIAIIIRSGSSTCNAVEISRKILQLADNDIGKLSVISEEELENIGGIGKTKAISVLAAIELGKRAFELHGQKERLRITSSEIAARLFSPLLRNIPHEEFWAAYLDRANRIIKKERLSSGGTFSTVVDIKILAKKAIDMLSSSVIIAHNHPSGNLIPGEQDRQTTENTKKALSMFDIRLMDHIIIAKNDYFSFADEGLI